MKVQNNPAQLLKAFEQAAGKPLDQLSQTERTSALQQTAQDLGVKPAELLSNLQTAAPDVFGQDRPSLEQMGAGAQYDATQGQRAVGGGVAARLQALTGGTSYYKQIDGMKYDRALLGGFEEAEAGARDGRVSENDIKAHVRPKALDGAVTDIEMNTLAFGGKNYNLTSAGQRELTTLKAEARERRGDPTAEQAVDSVNQHLKKVHGRFTEELRAEDAIDSLQANPDGTINVVAREHYDRTDVQLKNTAEWMLLDAGFLAPDLQVVRPQAEQVQAQAASQSASTAPMPAINPMPDPGPSIEPAINPMPDPGTPPTAKEAVDAANQALSQVHQRLTADIRTEDAISNFHLKDDGSVAVVVAPYAAESEDQIKDVANRILRDAGLDGAKLELVRPAIEPFPGTPMPAINPMPDPTPAPTGPDIAINPIMDPGSQDPKARFDAGIQFLNGNKPSDGPLKDVVDFSYITPELSSAIHVRVKLDGAELQAATPAIQEAVAQMLEQNGFPDLVTRNYLGNTIVVTAEDGAVPL